MSSNLTFGTKSVAMRSDQRRGPSGGRRARSSADNVENGLAQLGGNRRRSALCDAARVNEEQKPANSTAFGIRGGRRIKILRNRIRGYGVGADIGPGAEAELSGKQMVDPDLPVRGDDGAEGTIDGSRASRSQRAQGERRIWSVLNLPWHNKW